MKPLFRHITGAVALLTVFALPAVVFAQNAAKSSMQRELTGVYLSVSPQRALAGDYRTSGPPQGAARSPVSRLPKAKPEEQEEDAWKLCQAVGPFRMMATEGLKIELVPMEGALVMLFEDISHGNLRIAHLDRPHRKNVPESPQGDSVAHWEGDVLVIDTTQLGDRSWFDDQGSRHSDSLHLVERIRPLSGGNAFEYSMRAEDPKSLAERFTYTRYFERTDSEVREQVCEIESHWDCGDVCLK